MNHINNGPFDIDSITKGLLATNSLSDGLIVETKAFGMQAVHSRVWYLRVHAVVVRSPTTRQIAMRACADIVSACLPQAIRNKSGIEVLLFARTQAGDLRMQRTSIRHAHLSTLADNGIYSADSIELMASELTAWYIHLEESDYNP